jgi:hypothetical protein
LLRKKVVQPPLGLEVPEQVQPAQVPQPAALPGLVPRPV